MRRISRDDLRAPTKVIDFERFKDSNAIELPVGNYRTLWCLHRNGGTPIDISFWDVDNDATVRLDDLQDERGPLKNISEREARPSDCDVSEIDITVAICTRERPEQLRRALVSLKKQTDLDFRTIIVDNAPRSNSTAVMVEQVNLDRMRVRSRTEGWTFTGAKYGPAPCAFKLCGMDGRW